MNKGKGYLILKFVPPEKKEEVSKFLANYVSHRNNGRKIENIKDLLSKTPLILKKGIEKEKAQIFINKLASFSAEAIFIPFEEFHTENKNNLQKEKKEVDNSSSTQETFSLQRSQKFLDEFFPRSEPLKVPVCKRFKEKFLEEIYRVNKEFWLILSLVTITALMNFLLDAKQLFLSLYFLPTIFSAYYFGRRHAVMTAFCSIVLVVFFLFVLPYSFHIVSIWSLGFKSMRELVFWGGTLLISAYAVGTLYEKHQDKIKELRKTYQGLIHILRHFISKDEYTENHCYRVAVYAVKIAQYLGLPEERIEDLRAAALLHDIGKLKITREILYKAAKLSEEEYQEIKKHVTSAAEILDPLKGSLGRIIPIILTHHERCDGQGYLGLDCKEVPLEAKILAVADVYDALVSDRPYRKGLPPFEAKEIIVQGAGKHFDPAVVKAFVKAFNNGEMEVPRIVV